MKSLVTGSSFLVDRFPFGSTPNNQPVSDTLLKDHIQITHSLDDNIITGVGGYLGQATDEIESMGSVSLIKQKRTLVLDSSDVCGKSIFLPRGPASSITAIRYLDSDEVEQTLAASYYRFVANVNQVLFDSSLPAMADGVGSIQIDYEAGFGETSADVPERWQALVMQLTMRKYDYRTGDSGNTNESWMRLFKHQVECARDELRY